MDLRATGLLLVGFLAQVHSGPVGGPDEGRCARSCVADGKFDYRERFAYEYKYRAVTKTTLAGAAEDAASLKIRATVLIEPRSKCDFILTLKDVGLSDSGDKQTAAGDFLSNLEKPVWFSFQDGRIEEVCPRSDDTAWSLNFKRGILSSFQNSMDRFDKDQRVLETDVTGSCYVDYRKDGSSNSVKKTKNILSCVDRNGYQTSIQSIGYRVPVDIQSLPLLKSTHECNQKIDKDIKILRQSECKETHMFRPFSSQNNGAITETQQSLIFKSQTQVSMFSLNRLDDLFLSRTSLLFDHVYGDEMKDTDVKNVKDTIRQLCDIASTDIRPEVPSLFKQLVEQLRILKTDDLEDLLRTDSCNRNPDRIRKFLLDALPMVGTSSSVKVMQKLILRNQVTGVEADMWLTLLAFVQHPTRDMLRELMPLMEAGISGNALLSISSLASKYCSINPNCGNEKEVSRLIRQLIRNISFSCDIRQKDARMTVYTLRAIGNIGHSTEAVQRLGQCFNIKSNPMEVRLAAIDAFRKIPCDLNDRSDLMTVFKNMNEDSEIRIAAYLALMQCPTKDKLMDIRNVLENELANQVGSFVWTHLTNLQETSDPLLQDIRSILEDMDLNREFDLDKRKYSRNYEGSFFSEKFNAGAKLDSNLIWSSKSFVPRSAMVNLTIDLFGHSVNIFEMGGRIEGFEYFLESHFGPGAPKHTVDRAANLINKPNFKRPKDELHGSMYMRMFGNELYYSDIQDMRNSYNNFNLEKFLKNLSQNKEVSLTKSMTLLDSKLIIPTCLGLPLNLSVSATASTALRAKGYMNFQNFKNIEIKGSIEPSAAIEVVGEMSVDAWTSKTGLRMVTTAHTSTAAEFSIVADSGKLVDARFSLPRKKLEIFDLRSNFYIIRRSKLVLQKMIDNVKKCSSCTGQFMNSLTGLRLCQEVQFPSAVMQQNAPFFPFTGPTVLSLTLENEDVPRGFIAEVKLIQRPAGGVLGKVLFDTPMSKISRLISLDLDVQMEKKKLNISLISPWKTLNVESYYQNQKIIKLSAAYRSKEESGKTLEYKAEGELVMNPKSRYIPRLLIRTPSRQIDIQGSIRYLEGKKLDVDLSAKGITKDTMSFKALVLYVKKELTASASARYKNNIYEVTSKLGNEIRKNGGFMYKPELTVSFSTSDVVVFRGDIDYHPLQNISLNLMLDKVFVDKVSFSGVATMNRGIKKSECDMNVDFKSPWANFNTNGMMNINNARLTSRFKIDYTVGRYSDVILINSKIRNQSTKSLKLYLGNINMDRKEKQAFVMDFKFEQAKNHLETKLNLKYISKKQMQNFHFSSILNHKLSSPQKSVNYSMTLLFPPKDVDVGVKIQHVHSHEFPVRRISSVVVVQYAKDKEIRGQVDFVNPKSQLYNSRGSVILSTPGWELMLEETFRQNKKTDYENELKVRHNRRELFTLKSSYSQAGQSTHEVKNTLLLPNYHQAIANGFFHFDGRYLKSKLELDMDEGIISKSHIRYVVEMSGNYSRNKNKMVAGSSLGVEWNSDQIITVEGSFQHNYGQKMSGKFGINTPFEVLHTASANWKYVWDSEQQSSEVFLNYNKHQIHGKMKLDMEPFNFNINVQLECPWRSRGMKTEVYYSNDNLEGSLLLTEDYKRILKLFVSNKNRHGYEKKTNVKLEMDRYNGEFMLKHGSHWRDNSEGFLTLNQPHFLHKLDIKYKLVEDGLTSEVYFVSSHETYRNGNLTISTKNGVNEMNMDTKLHINNKTYAVLTMKYNSGMYGFNFEAMGVNGKMEVKHTAREQITMHLDFQFMNYMSIKLNGDLALHWFTNRGNLNLDVSMQKHGDVKLVTKWFNKDISHRIDFTLTLPDRKEISAESFLRFADAATGSKIALKVSSDFPTMQKFDLSLEYYKVGMKGHFELKPLVKRISVESTLMFSGNYNGKLNIQTDYMNLGNIEAKFSVGNNVWQNDLRANITMNGVLIFDANGDYQIRSLKDFGGKLLVTTTHSRFHIFKVELAHNGNFPKDFDCKLILQAGRDVSVSVIVEQKRRSSSLEAEFMISGYKKSQFTLSRKGMFDNVVFSAKVQTGDEGKYMIKAKHRNDFSKRNVDVSLSSPSHDDITAVLSYEIHPGRFSSEIQGKFGEEVSVHCKISSDFDYFQMMNIDGEYSFRAYRHTSAGKLVLINDDSSAVYKQDAVFSYNDKKIKLSSTVFLSRNMKWELMLDTPFHVAANMTLKVITHSFYDTDLLLKFKTPKTTGWQKIEYNHNAKKKQSDVTNFNVKLDTTLGIKGNVELMMDTSSLKTTDLIMDFETPWSARSHNIKYNHLADFNRRGLSVAVDFVTTFNIDANMKLNVNRSQYWNTNLQIAFSTPLQDRKQKITYIHNGQDIGQMIKLNAKLDTTFKVNTDVKLNLDGYFRGTNDRNLRAADITIKVRTPFMSEWIVSKHSHSLHQNSFVLSQKVLLNNGYSNRDYLKVKTNLDFADDYSGRLTVNWEDKSIVTTAELKPVYPPTGNLDVRSTFDAFKRLYVKYEPNKMDADLELDLKNMKYSVGTFMDHQSARGNVSLNWDKNCRDCNYDFQAAFMNAKSRQNSVRKLDVKVLHPANILGLSGSLRTNSEFIAADGQVEWDKVNQHKAGFLAELKRFDKQNVGKFKVITPERNLQVLGTYIKPRDNRAEMEATFMWNANRDNSQKITFIANVDFGRDMLDTDFIMKFPKQKKGVQLKTVVRRYQNQVLFDGRTEFSLDQEQQKTLIFVTKVTSIDKGHTLNVGLTHPHSKLNTWLKSYYTHSSGRGACKSEVSLEYDDSKGKTQTFKMVGTINKQTQEGNLELLAPGRYLKLIGNLHTSDDLYKLGVKVDTTNSDLMETDVAVDFSRNTVHFQMNYDLNQDKIYHVTAGYHNGKDVIVEAYRTATSQQTIQDGKFFLHLNTSRILHARLDWRPTLMNDIYQFSQEKIRRYQRELMEMKRELQRILLSEASARMELTKRSFGDDIEILQRMGKQTVRQLMNEFNLCIKYMKEFYNRNYLNVKTMYQAVEASFMKTRAMLEDLKMTLDKKFEEKLQQLEILWMHLRIAYADVYSMLVKQKDNIKQQIINRFALFRKQNGKFIRWSTDKYMALYRKSALWLEDKWETVEQMPGIRKAQSFITSITYDKVIDKMQAVLEATKQKTGAMMEGFNDGIEYLQGKMRGFLDDLRQNCMVNSGLTLIHDGYDQAKLLRNYWEGHKIKDNLLNYGTRYVKELRDQYLDFNQVKVIKFAPKRGEIEFEIELPVPLYSLHKFDHLRLDKDIHRIMRRVNRWIPGPDTTVSDIYYTYKPSSNIANWIPPFEAFATVHNDQHITTFDGQHFGFVGDCSYLLTRDTVDGNFTIILNYKNKKVKSITIYAYEDKVDLFSNYKVELDDQPVELPQQLGYATIRRVGHIIRFDSYQGFAVFADPLHELYTVNISGYYFGKVFGLMGTYNNEMNDDLTMSDMTVTNDVTKFANSWLVSKYCHSQRNYAMDHTFSENEECAALFQFDESPLRACFHQVDPEPFNDFCLVDTQSAKAFDETCKAAAHYVYHCEKAGVPLRLPRECVHCLTESGDYFIEGDNITISTRERSKDLPSSADIVVVVEERSCNMNDGKQIAKLLNEVESKLTEKGFTHNKYGLVGIGGVQPYEYTRTMNGQLMAGVVPLENMLKSMQYKKGSESLDIMKAVMSAARYPFRTAVTKSIILVTCSECREQDISYYELEDILSEREITLHVIKPQDFKLTGNKSPKTGNIFGIDNKEVFHKKNQKNRKKEQDYNSIKIPDDMCVQLALETNGSLFDGSRLNQRTFIKNSFIDAVSKRISSKEQEECQICKCVQDERGIGTSVCKACPSSSGIYFFNFSSGLEFLEKLNDKNLLNQLGILKTKVRKYRRKSKRA